MASKFTADAQHRGAKLDDESKAMMYAGLNLTQLGLLLEMDHKLIRERLEKGGVQPVGTRNGAAIYKIKDVAPWVVKPGYSIAEYIQRMSPADLPKLIQKEFWAGMKSRQEFQIKAGELWETSKVIEKVGEVLKMVRMHVLLTCDTVERQVELTDRQRQLIAGIMDGLLTDMADAIVEHFGSDEPREIVDLPKTADMIADEDDEL